MYRVILLVAVMAMPTTGIAQVSRVQTLVQRGHADRITALDFSPDGRFFITGSADHTVKLWDLKTGREIRSFTGHLGEVKDVHLDAEEGIIVSAAAKTVGAELRVWNMLSGAGEKEIEGGKKLTTLGVMFGNIDFEWAWELRSFDLHPNGTLAWAEDNHGIKIGRINKGKYDRILDTNWEPSVVRFSPDGRILVAGGGSFNRKVGSESNEIALWDADGFKPRGRLKTTFGDITSLCFDKEGKRLAVLSHQVDSGLVKKKSTFVYFNSIEVFSLESNQRLFEFSWLGTKSSGVGLSPDGARVVVPMKTDQENDHEQLAIFDVITKLLRQKFDSREPEIYSLGFSPDGKVLVANGMHINFWKTSSWTHLREIVTPTRIEDIEVVNHRIHTVRSVGAHSQFGLIDLETGNYQGTHSGLVQAVRRKEGKVYVSLEGKVVQVSSDGVDRLMTLVEKVEGWKVITDFLIEETGKYVVCLNEFENSIFVQQLTGGRDGFFLKGHRKAVSAMALAGTLLATGGKDNRVLLWNLETRQRVGEFLGHNGAVKALGISSDRTLLASGASDNYVKLWDIGKGSAIETLRGHESDVLTVDFDPSGEFLASGSGDPQFEGKSEVIGWDVKRRKLLWKASGNDGYTRKVVVDAGHIYCIGNDPVVKILDKSKGQEKFKVVPLTETDVVISDRENYYIATKGSFPYIHFVNGLKVYSFENFDLKYNRPDLILKKLGSSNLELIEAYRKIYLRRLKQSGFTENEIGSEMELPAVEIVNADSIAYVAETDMTELRLSMKETKETLRYYNVWVNGVPLFGSKGKPIAPNNLRKLGVRIKVPLHEGYNKIEAGCINSQGAKSPRELVEVMWQGKRKPDLYLVAVCASRYSNSAMNLTYSVKDGKDIANLFSSTKEFGRVHLTTLFDDQVTKSNFRQARQKLAESSADDEVILFMAGHGVLDKNFDFHFVTFNMDFDQPSETAISFDDIEQFMDSIPARKKMVLLDACHSGGIDKLEIEDRALEMAKEKSANTKVQNMEALRRTAFKLYYGVDNTFVEMMEEMFHALGDGTGAYVISAASGNGYAFESAQWSNGVFTYSLLDGLENARADRNADGRVTVSELKDYLLENVVRLTNNNQRPTCRKENPDMDFVVWRK